MSGIAELIQKHAATRKSGGGNRYRPKFKPSNNPVRLRLIRGEYTHPDGVIREVGFLPLHYSARRQKVFVCSAEWTSLQDNDGRCIGCYAAMVKDLPDSPEILPYKKLSVSSYVRYPATVFIMEDFHLDPHSWKGEELGFDKDGKQMYRKVLCTSRADCEGCKKGYKKVWGRRIVWELPMTHLNALHKAVSKFRNVCGSCGTPGLEVVDVTCPECGRSIPGQNLDPDEMIRCPHCGKKIQPLFEYHCQNKECIDPRPPDIFDVDFSIESQQEERGMAILPVVLRVGPPDPKIPEDQLKPLDFDRLYQPMSLGQQAILLKVENPFLKDQAFEYGQDEGDVPF